MPSTTRKARRMETLLENKKVSTTIELAFINLTMNQSLKRELMNKKRKESCTFCTEKVGEESIKRIGLCSMFSVGVHPCESHLNAIAHCFNYN